jgi:hypothetical protein
VLHNRKPQKIFRGERESFVLQTENPKEKEQREKREQREEREKKEFSEEMRGEREIFGTNISWYGVGSEVKNIDFLIFTKCTVAFHF